MPLQETRVRALVRIGWRKGPSGPVHKAAYAVRVVGVTGYEDVEIVGKGDQAAIEHPVRRSGKRDAVVDDVGSIRLDRPDMGSVDLGTAAAIDQL